MRVAGIDIGTNTLLMVVGEKTENSDGINWIADFHSIARLGEGLDNSGIISETAISRAVKILEDYRQKIAELNVDRVVAYATSAMRDANNSTEVKQKLESVLRFEIIVIDGKREAELSFLGTIDDDKIQSGVIDIGGGSTEFIYGRGSEIHSKKSINIGAVRLFEKFIHQQPPNDDDVTLAENHSQNLIDAIDLESWKGKVYAVAGTPTTLASIHLGLGEFDYDKIHNFEFSYKSLVETMEMIRKMSRDDIANRFGVHQNRADIIYSGGIILQEFLRRLPNQSCFVSCKGLRYGIVTDYFNNNFGNIK